MVCKITWLPRALKTYISNIEYLEAKWTEKEIKLFIDITERKIENISHHPKPGRVVNKNDTNIRFTLIHTRVALIYKHKPLKNEIELLVFWNTYQNPGKMKLRRK